MPKICKEGIAPLNVWFSSRIMLKGSNNQIRNMIRLISGYDITGKPKEERWIENQPPPASPYRWLGNKPKWWLEIPTLGNWLWDTMRRANLWVQVSCHGLQRFCYSVVKTREVEFDFDTIVDQMHCPQPICFLMFDLETFPKLQADRSTSSWLLWWSGFFGWDPPKSVSWSCFNEDPVYPAGGFKYFVFSPLPGKMIQFD